MLSCKLLGNLRQPEALLLHLLPFKEATSAEKTIGELLRMWGKAGKGAV